MFFPQTGQLCVFWREAVEDREHVFLLCNFTSSLWSAIFTWMGVDLILPQDILSLYSQLGACVWGRKFITWRHMFWHVTCWSVWNLRNNIIFREGSIEFVDGLQKIKSTSRQWVLYKKGIKPGIFFSSWNTNPIGCLHNWSFWLQYFFMVLIYGGFFWWHLGTNTVIPA